MKSALLCTLLATALGPQSASASAVIYSSESSFLTALGGATVAVESFEASFSPGPSRSFAGFTATESGPGPILFRTTTFATAGVASLATNLDPAQTLVFAFDSPINAFSFDLRNSTGSNVSFQTNAGASGSLPTSNPAVFGVIDRDGSFTRIAFSHGSVGAPFLAMDQVRFGTVPEPSAAGLFAFATLLSAGRRGRRMLESSRVLAQ